jgi:hypothetical protein
MTKFKLLIAALLAAVLISFSGAITVPGLFSAPSFSMYHTGFNQISPSKIGTSPILYAPSMTQLLNGGSSGMHMKPILMTSNWSSSMKTSPVNQMFAILSRGIGNNNV